MQRLAAVEWGERLGGLTPEQLARGLESWHGDWPPSVEELRTECLGKGKRWEHSSKAYQSFDRMLPKPKAKQKTVDENLAKMRAALGRGNTSKPAPEPESEPVVISEAEEAAARERYRDAMGVPT